MSPAVAKAIQTTLIQNWGNMDKTLEVLRKSEDLGFMETWRHLDWMDTSDIRALEGMGTLQADVLDALQLNGVEEITKRLDDIFQGYVDQAMEVTKEFPLLVDGDIPLARYIDEAFQHKNTFRMPLSLMLFMTHWTRWH
jgi:hypothetical protein